MIAPARAVRVFAYPRPTDLRKGYNGLYGLVAEGLRSDPLSGDLFLFVNRKRTSCKVLLFDGTGLCIFMKRLEQGQFADVWREDCAAITLTGSELSLFIEGCSMVGSRPLSPPPITSF
ncbi:MAG: IS66 family insertion sequence element accessory protein TnpB [bacterium]|nr:IS66 family insertion sequence element accessory protein TnpB [bacterium]